MTDAACGSQPGTTIQSKAVEADTTCPACGAAVPVVMWELLEADCNPERAAQLAIGALLVQPCPRCGAPVPLDYPLFYEDRTRKVAAFYPAGQGSLDAISRAFTQAVTRFRGVDLSSLRRREFAMRVVSRRHELPERVCVWNADLDDELFEVFKATLLRELKARNPQRRLCDLQFTGTSEDGERLEFVLFCDQEGPDGSSEVVPAGAGVGVPRATYRQLGQSVEVRSAIDLHRSPVVDTAWAARVLEAAESERR